MIQTRKVQYLCMSKLSAKELVNRAHQFVADGDKRSHVASRNTTASAGTLCLCIYTVVEAYQPPCTQYIVACSPGPKTSHFFF